MSASEAGPIPDTQSRPVPPVEGLAPGDVAAWIAWATRTLEAASPSARADAEELMAAQLALRRAQLSLRLEDAMPAARALQYAAAVERRRMGEPVAYVTGRQGFWSIELSLSPAALIPRADTETLVEWALQIPACAAVMPAQAGIQLFGNRGSSVAPERLAGSETDIEPVSDRPDALRGSDGIERPIRVLDLGTGSGAIALALARELPTNVQIIATDHSDAALDLARENARALDIHTVEFRGGSWFDALRAGAPSRFDLIVSNPPYIAEGDAHLAALRYEPRLALIAGADGLDAIREIVNGAPAHLETGAWLLLEHGHDQGAAVRALLASAGFAEVQTRRDFGGNERVSGGRRA